MPYQYNGIQVYYYGEEGSGFLKQKEIQDFEKIRSEYAAKGELWKDPLFEPLNEALDGEDKNVSYTLKRPKEITSEPNFLPDIPYFQKGSSSYLVGDKPDLKFDAIQGKVGDCWLIASISALASLPKNVFFTVVPHDQDFENNYAGVFHFRFWKYGEWVDVVVDDRLPYNDTGACFAHTGDGYKMKVFWVALLEKAYAKLYGSYGALKAGLGSDALEEFTGGIAEIYRFYEPNTIPDNLFEEMMFAYEHHWPMVCCTPDGRKMFELPSFHSYTVTGLNNVKTNSDETVKLVHLRNPYGELTGSKTVTWTNIKREERNKIKDKLGEDNGEFWIEYNNFIKAFRTLQICRYDVNWSKDGGRSGHKGGWSMEMVAGVWKRWSTAGGCADYTSYTENPICKLKVYEMENEENKQEAPREAKEYRVRIALMQNHRKSQRAHSRKHNQIGFNLYQAPEGSSDWEAVIKGTEPLLKVSGFNREVSRLAMLCAGEYIIVPYPQEPHVASEFVLRVFSPNAVTIGEIPRKQPIPTHLEENKENELASLFSESARDNNEIDWRGLKDILDNYMKKDEGTTSWFETVVQGGFHQDVCSSLLTAYDGNKTGNLSFDEFRELWIDVLYWKNVFVELSKSKPGYLSLSELDIAIRRTYLKLNAAVNCLPSELIARFGSDGYISFPNYLMCAIRFITLLKNLMTDEEPKAKLKKDLANWFEDPIAVD